VKDINRNLYPRDGYWFKEADGLTIRADSWSGLFKRVANYRKRAGYPTGNVEQEVVTQACGRNPGICTEENQTYKTELKKSNLKGRVLAWLNAKTRDKERQLSFEQDARARAAVCAGCPRNQALPDGCASCRQAVQESRKSIIGARFQDGRLNVCSVLGEDLNTSMWLEQIREENSELPANCWRKRTL
jgi:hypothetical protein